MLQRFKWRENVAVIIQDRSVHEILSSGLLLVSPAAVFWEHCVTSQRTAAEETRSLSDFRYPSLLARYQVPIDYNNHRSSQRHGYDSTSVENLCEYFCKFLGHSRIFVCLFLRTNPVQNFSYRNELALIAMVHERAGTARFHMIAFTRKFILTQREIAYYIRNLLARDERPQISRRAKATRSTTNAPSNF